MWAANKQQGFTIVELLIVIVVVGILAAITLVAYNGAQDRARSSRIVSSLGQVSKKVKLWKIENSDQYPATLAEIGIANTSDATYQYTSNNGMSPATFCVTLTIAGTSSYVSSSNDTAQNGVCASQNLLLWNESQASMPVPGATYDTATYRSPAASMRLGPSQVGLGLRGNPYTGTVGQVYTVSLWIMSDATWNGTGGNSKIRFGNSQDGSLLAACGYNGVKATWVQASCSFTLTSTATSLTISVGNDGTIGNIWLDDIIVSRS